MSRILWDPGPVQAGKMFTNIDRGAIVQKNLLILYKLSSILPDFRRFSQNIVLRSPGEYSSEKDC